MCSSLIYFSDRKAVFFSYAKSLTSRGLILQVEFNIEIAESPSSTDDDTAETSQARAKEVRLVVSHLKIYMPFA